MAKNPDDFVRVFNLQKIITPVIKPFYPLIILM